MTDRQYAQCVSAALTYGSRNAYLSDMSMLPLWGDAPQNGILADRLALLGEIYDATHRSVREIVALSGMSQRKFADRFCIPLRTVENWCRGISDCAIYIRLLLQTALGIPIGAPATVTPARKI